MCFPCHFITVKPVNVSPTGTHPQGNSAPISVTPWGWIAAVNCIAGWSRLEAGSRSALRVLRSQCPLASASRWFTQRAGFNRSATLGAPCGIRASRVHGSTLLITANPGHSFFHSFSYNPGSKIRVLSPPPKNRVNTCKIRGDFGQLQTSIANIQFQLAICHRERFTERNSCA